MLKRIASALPPMLQQELRRWKVFADLKRGRYASNEPEFKELDRLVHPGDWVLDIGANVGYYTMRLAHLVGVEGHVFAFEPIGATAEILTFIVRFAPRRNVTVFNTAVSDKSELLKFSIPKNESGLPNYFTARVSQVGIHPVFAINVDGICFPRRISLIKIDTEGSEVTVLRGMEALLRRDNPILIIEGDETLEPYLAGFGYRMRERQAGSANLLFLPESGFDAARSPHS